MTPILKVSKAMRCVLSIAVVAAAITVNPSVAGFTVHQGNGSSWFENVPSRTTITFEEFPAGTLITEQYSPLGVHFVDADGGDWIHLAQGFSQDGHGLFGHAVVELTFDAPTLAFASYFPGMAQFDFYSGANLLFHSPMMGGGGYNFFAGFTTDVGFDRIRIYGNPPDVFGNPDPIFFDNFYFSSIPGPGGACIVIVFSPFAFGSRRRTQRPPRASRAV